MRNESYVQHIYHFPHPMNSIDVKTITPEVLNHCIKFYNNFHLYQPERSAERKFYAIEQMFKDNFPEYLI